MRRVIIEKLIIKILHVCGFIYEKRKLLFALLPQRESNKYQAREPTFPVKFGFSCLEIFQIFF